MINISHLILLLSSPSLELKKKYTINEEKAHENKEKKASLQKY